MGNENSGRTSTFCEKTVEEICSRISEGEPLRVICRDEHMPAYRTVYDWMKVSKDFAARFAHARELGEDALAEECLDIADNSTNDWLEVNGDNQEATGWKFNSEHVQRSKLRIETRLKLLAKWNPKKYGDKITQEHTGANGTALQPPVFNFQPVKPKDD